MRSRTVILSLWGAIVAAIPVAADELTLKDGRVLQGQALREGKVWTIVTEDGETLTFSVEEVKRHIFESRVTPLEAARMMKELLELVTPVLGLPEPDQYVWLRDITEHSGSYSYQAESGTVVWKDRVKLKTGQYEFDRQQGAERSGFRSKAESADRWESKTLRDKGVDNVFVDQWARYVAYFERLSEDLRYEELTRRRKYSGSLAEFAVWPPGGYEKQAEAVKTALEAVAECIELAATTQRMVRAIPTKQRKLKDAIAKAENRAARARDKLKATPTNQKEYQKKRVRDAEDAVRGRVAKMNSEMPKATRNAELKINDFARRREVAKGALVRAANEMGAVYTEQPVRGTDAPQVATFPLADAIEQGLQQVESHRQRCKGLAPLGLEALRAKTHANIRELFTGRTFVMGLYFKTNDHAPGGAYQLVAEDRAENQGESRVRVMLHFDQSFFNDLAMCTKDTGITLEASIQNVTLSPALEELEGSTVEPVFLVQGNVIAVEQGCG